MQIVNLRHLGYPDNDNILLTLQAPDDPNGVIHHETARLACCVLAANRWDGYLSITQEHPKPVSADEDILRRKDYYFHLPDGGDSKDGGERPKIDKRNNKNSPYAVTARFRDWNFPDTLPALWIAAGDAAMRKAIENGLPVNEDGDLISEFVCRICGTDEECKLASLWPAYERDIWEREKEYLAIYPDLSDPNKDGDEDGPGNLLRDNRNWLRIGEHCSADDNTINFFTAFQEQFLFVPKLDDDGEPCFVAHSFATEETGISDFSTIHNKPLLLPEKTSVELLFAHFA